MHLRRAEAGLECGSGEALQRKRNCRRRADLPPAWEAQHNPKGSHSFANGVTNPSDGEHRGHYPTARKARVKQVKRGLT